MDCTLKYYFSFDIHSSVHHDTIFTKMTNKTQFCRIIYCSFTALHVSSDTIAHHQEHLNRNYSFCNVQDMYIPMSSVCTYLAHFIQVNFGHLLTKYIAFLALSIHPFSSLSYDRPKASSKASSPHSAIQSFLFQMRVSSPFLKVIQ